MVIDEDYFIKYLKNELTEEETRRLIAWVKEKKENQGKRISCRLGKT